MYIRHVNLAKRWDVSQRTLRKYVADGRIPQPIRISKNNVIWPLSDIEAIEAGWKADGPTDPRKGL